MSKLSDTYQILLFYITGSFAIVQILLFKRTVASAWVFGKRVFFNNINCFGIILKNLKEVKQARKRMYLSTDLFCDVGAHIGSKLLIFNRINPNVECLAFEPSAINYDMLCKNTADISNVLSFKTALSDARGETILYYDKKHLDVGSLNRNHYYLVKNSKGNVFEEKVELHKLDDYLDYIKNKKNVFLKIDVESLELKVLKGGQEFLKSVRFLEIEISQSQISTFTDAIKFIPKSFNIIDIDLFYSEGYVPKAINLLIEFM